MICFLYFDIVKFLYAWIDVDSAIMYFFSYIQIVKFKIINEKKNS